MTALRFSSQLTWKASRQTILPIGGMRLSQYKSFPGVVGQPTRASLLTMLRPESSALPRDDTRGIRPRLVTKSNFGAWPHQNREETHDANLPQSVSKGTSHRAIVAFGSNIGDRVGMIEHACNHVLSKGIRIRATSFLYETAPMYVTDQATFYNGVCEIETTLSPHGLLDALQGIENDLGRQRIMDKGPRNIDLDIVLFDDEIIHDDRLNIPHRLMLEREFVLRPLADLVPDRRLPAPHDYSTISDHLKALDRKGQDSKALHVAQLAPNLPCLKIGDPGRPTHLMAILNATPDSFSNDGLLKPGSKEALTSAVQNLVSSGASIIDVGGQSTRPNAERVSPEEELERILPAIEAICNSPHRSTVAISVDTFHSEVARVAIEAGADIINDVSAGTLDAQMFDTVAKLGKTIILMHMRGDPTTMRGLTSYPDGIIQGIGRELRDRVQAALAAGIPRWRIILDPGIGFAKTQTQNLEILRRLADLRQYPCLQGYPWLVGASRKGFIGKITRVQDPSQRVWGTAAAVTASVQAGADIVRVHDVEEMRAVVHMADAIYRSGDA